MKLLANQKALTERHPIVIDALLQIAPALESRDYQKSLGLVQWIVQNGNFSEVSSFLPGIKNLIQIAAQLKV